MKVLILNYTFDASAQTITFNDYGNIDHEGVLVITNVTDQEIIYNFADATKGGTVATNVLTLEYDTTSMSDTDALQIWYDDSSAALSVDVASAVDIGATILANGADDLANTLDQLLTASVVYAYDGTGFDRVSIGGGTEATALRVTIASDSTGVLSIDDNGGSITVDGTVSVTGVSTAANQTTIIGHLDGVEGLLTTIDADTGGILTSVQLLDDAAVVLGTATYTEATSVGFAIGAVRRDADTTLVNTTNEWGPLQMDANGRLKVEVFSGETLPVSLTSTTITGSVTVDSELPTAAALADNTANPTAPAVGAFGMLWDGATWDRQPGNSTDGLLVNLGANNDITGTVTANLAAGTNNIGDVDVLSVPAPLSTTGGGTEAAALRVTIASDSTGVLSIDDNGGSITVDGSVTVSATNLDIRDLVAATDAISVHGDVGIIDQLDLTNSNPAVVAIVDGNGDQITSFGGGTQFAEDAAHSSGATGTLSLGVRRDSPSTMTNADGDYHAFTFDGNGAAWVSLATKLDATNDAVAIGSRTTGGLTIFRSIDLDESEEEIKGTAGQLYGYYFMNLAATTLFLKFYNATAASVTVGTTTPVMTIPVPAGAAGHVSFPQGIAFSTAICVAVTTGIADANSGAPGANEFVLNAFYT